ncbi:casein kinase II subunit beta, partial [Radiomyces spectabilis]|uniref:casein kinase II subunit beta n=1 Tax=Radiomyces spectabilis TaxID=64574 RepID=UPI00221FC72A
EYDSQSSVNTSLQSWISWFCTLPGNEFYVEVPEEFIEDDFNLTGLSSVVPYYNEALEMILDIETEEKDSQQGQEDPDEEKDLTIEPYAAMLYGLIHQRYLLTRHGQRIMAQRFAEEQFGTCPRVFCDNCPVIPCGRYDQVGKESVRLYCPSCMDLYHSPNDIHVGVDGAHFGTTYAHLMFQAFSELIPIDHTRIYEPRIFGFRINERSPSGPRMQWLRMRP